MVEFPLAKMVLMGEIGSVDEIVTIVSLLSVPTVFFRSKDRIEESDAAREKFVVPDSDHLTLLNVYNQWRRNDYSEDWCSRHFLQVKALLRKAREVRSQLLDLLITLRIPLASTGPRWDAVRAAICSAYFHKAAHRRNGAGEYAGCRNGTPCHMHPSSALYGSGCTQDYIVFHEAVVTAKGYIRCATAVEPQWLAEYGPVFFAVKESDETAVECRKKQKEGRSGMEEEEEMERLRKGREEEERKRREKERVKRFKEQRCSMPGLNKRLGL